MITTTSSSPAATSCRTTIPPRAAAANYGKFGEFRRVLPPPTTKEETRVDGFDRFYITAELL